jgi:flagellar P-ring protein FlgI
MIIKKSSIIFALAVLTLMSGAAYSVSAPARIKDIAHILEARDNQLIGFGLVAGLKNTGDTVQTEFTKQAMTNLLSRMGIAPMEKEFRSRNVAAVMVTAKLPAYVTNGQNIDVTVSSMGDSTSLQGGTLLMTPLQGPDDNIYAVAQGSVSVGISGLEMTAPLSERRPTTVGRIANGAIVEKEVPVSMDENLIVLVLDKPDFTTANRVARAIKAAGYASRARDAATIVVSREGEIVSFISEVENLTIVPDSVAKIIINELTGVIVMGENVRISPVAISYSGMNISITGPSSDAGTITELSGATISDLVSALNAIGIKPKDLISIIQAIKSAGAISADLEVI